MKGRGLIYVCSLVLLFVISCLGQVHHLPASEVKAEIQTLEFGQTVERDVATGDRHIYKIKLSQNQFIKIQALQTGCDIMLALQSPENVNIFEYKDDNYQNGSETQTAAVARAGDYELRIVSFDDPNQKGRYSLKVSELRAATTKELKQTSGFQILNKLSKIEPGALTSEQIRHVIEQFDSALEEFRFAENRQYEALTLSSIGSFYTRLGNWSKAAELQRQAREINRSIGGKSDTSVLLTNLGNTYFHNNEPHKALEVLYESVALAIKSDDIFNESRALSLIGNVYEEIGDTNRALTYYEQALEKAQSISQDNFAAVALNNLGKVNLTLGENEKAADNFQKSIELARRKKNKRVEAAGLSNLGQTFFKLGNETKATECLTEGLRINRTLDDKVGEAAVLRTMGKISLALGKTDEAIEMLNQAQTLERTVENPRYLAETLLLLAKATVKKENLDIAQAKMEEAIGLIEKVRLQMQTSELRDSFSANLQNFYSFYIELLMARHKLEPNKNFATVALQANESAHARGLLNLLAESNTDIRQGIDEKLVQKETELRNLLSARLENLTKVLNGKAKGETGQKLKAELEQIRSAYDQIQAQIRTASPRYAALTQPKTLSVKEIQAEVLDADSVMLEYALGETKSFLWVVSKNEFRSFELPAAKVIEGTARQFYEALTARNKQVKFETAAERDERIFRADSDLNKFSGELGRMILTPAAPFIANKRLLIVADGALQYVPFAALSPGGRESKNQASKIKNKFLIETNEVISSPSASALAVLRKETIGRVPAPKTLAVMADPVFDKEDARFQIVANRNKPKQEDKIELIAVTKKRTRAAGDSRDGLDLARLPFTRLEADLITSVVPEGQKEKWLDFAANRQSATSPQLANYRFVHFATHGFINDQNPELSGLVFSTIDENGKEQDGFLRVGDIYNLRLPAEMVVLSGCRTGLGKDIKGEGLVGMTRAFMYAGAKRVTVSLWDINDEATSELMSHFYREIFAGQKRSPASALREAQNTMINDKRWSNPYFWATFVLQGESR